ncbi:high-affinity nicotinic acid transporter [Annulohypoxylon truncatum]|uniref:high-affinity nicotinic acid transporter n=1 Tax=Annulohypoxylon truncatum TaxID=327061 RepID=UPI0020075CFA|nr:high-affinity nicotinic acid transporter [Annulohypoxylon truncatum]KAI1204387.1 high-affinity nicotinic acid transporter [Annulohypoxylon truncatum]
MHAAEGQRFDVKATKRLLRKIDIHILPIMCLICLLCFLDRANIGNARLDNLESDLHLVGLQYNDCLAILFPFYVMAEIPSNIMMKHTKPSTWLAFIMFAWSACIIGQGFVTNYQGLMATRALLGTFEGGFFPGINFYITQWYPRNECGLRMAIIFSSATIAGALGGIVARGIAEMSGVGGLSAWSWIFIIEGLASIVVSVLAYWAIHGYPASAHFLTPAERHEVERRLIADSGSLSNDFDVKYIWQAFLDWKIYVHMVICMGGFCAVYSFSLFLPTIIKNMGYSANNAQLMSAPPYVLACLFAITGSRLADRCRQRGVFLLGFQLVAILGLAMLAASVNPTIQYAGTVFAAVGIYPQIPLGLAWNGSNIGGSLKRATGIAMQVAGGNLGGIIASYVYLARDAPRYIVGHSILIGSVGLAFIMTLFMTIWCRGENARRDTIARQTLIVELTVEQKMQERELADGVPWFRYTI